MDLRQLEHFVAVAEERHFTRAAIRLHIVQSGLSASIRALEDEIGAALFERTTRRVNLTQTGQAFLDEARRVLSAAKIARGVVADMQSLRRGRLMIGAIQGLSPSSTCRNFSVIFTANIRTLKSACPSMKPAP